MPTVKELVNFLTNSFTPEDIIAYDIWQVEDVKSLRVDIENPEGILEEMHYKKDANIGLNWTTLEFYCTDEDEKDG